MKKAIVLVVSFLMFAASAQAANDLGSLQEYIAVGRVLSVGLNSSPTGWFITSNSNPNVASAVLGQNSVLITGQSFGSATILVCTDSQATHCLSASVTVGGSVLGESVSPHAPGSWVLDHGTVYYITTDGIIPISTWKIFLSNGGKQSLIQQSNQADLSLSLLPLMTLHDSRVK
jgi:hypothetical protein